MVTCTIVAYHYIHNESKNFPKVFTKSIEDFKNQLKFLSIDNKIISLSDYVAFLNNEKDIPEKVCVLTFDDGLLDHYSNAIKILKELSLPATFFCPVLPLIEKKVLPVQMLQCLVAKVRAIELIDECHKQLKKCNFKVSDFKVSCESNSSISLWYEPGIFNLKNNIGKMDVKTQRSILEPLFEKYIGSQEEYWNMLYLKPHHLRDMAHNGFEIGSHSYNHLVLFELDEDILRKELFESKVLLKKITDVDVTSFSIPYGRFLYDDIVLYKLKQYGYKCCLNSEFKVNYGRENPFALGRIDQKLIGDKIEKKDE